MATNVMPQQGDLALLEDPVAKEVLASKIPARLAYTWTDGSPRVIPIVFHWDGREFVMASPPESPKTLALHDGDRVALTIDTDTFPYHVLMARGPVSVQFVDGVPPEYTAACRRYLGPEAGEGWSAQMGQRFPRMMRIALRPDWIGIIDFERRMPSALS